MAIVALSSMVHVPKLTEHRRALLLAMAGMVAVIAGELVLYGIEEVVAEVEYGRFGDPHHQAETACEHALLSPPRNAQAVVLKHGGQSRTERFALPLSPEQAIRLCNAPEVSPEF